MGVRTEVTDPRGIGVAVKEGGESVRFLMERAERDRMGPQPAIRCVPKWPWTPAVPAELYPAVGLYVHWRDACPWGTVKPYSFTDTKVEKDGVSTLP